jgi:exopolysaccharide biosynthesis polyprenyl glycosylphosphotransferase
MKRSEIIFGALQVPVDYCMIVLAALTAFTVRDIPQILAVKEKLYHFPFQDYLDIVLLVAPFFLLIYALEGLYQMRVTRRFWQEAFAVFKATSLVLIIMIVAIFLKREWFSSRFIILAGWMLSVFYVVFARYLLRSVQQWFLINQGVGVHRVLLIGTNGKIKSLLRIFQKRLSLGYKVVDNIEDASITHIKEIREREGIDEIILCDPSITDSEQEKLLDYCEINNIAYKYLPTTLQTSRFSLTVFNGEPMIEFEHTPLDGWGKVVKRSFDIIGSLFGVIVFSPVMLLIAAALKLEDPTGPIVYKNERLGENGEKFFVFKFRYMKWRYCINKENPDFEEAVAYERKLIEERSVRKGPLYKIKDDPRKTKVGAIIERYSLDELPQFFNVLFGDMSLVGPRPHQAREVNQYKEYHRRLLTIRPGITGLAQISGRSDLPFEDEYRLDVFYIENWSLWFDISVCFKTIGAILRRRRNE